MAILHNWRSAKFPLNTDEKYNRETWRQISNENRQIRRREKKEDEAESDLLEDIRVNQTENQKGILKK